MNQKYKYFIVDAQLVLTRCYYMLKDSDRFGIKSLAESVFYLVAKAVKSVGGAQKVILLWDKYPYHKNEIVSGSYKGDRKYLTEDDLDPTIEVTDADIHRMKIYLQLPADEKLDPKWDEFKPIMDKINKMQELEKERKKAAAKYYIINHYGNMGMPSLIREGWEADDWCQFISEYLEGDSEISCSYTTDGDWPWFVTDSLHFIKIPKKGNELTIMDRQAVLNIMPLEVRDMKFLHYRAILDSLAGGHNNLQATIKKGITRKKSWGMIIEDIVKNDNLDEYVDDIEQYKINLKTHDLHSFPDADLVKQEVTNIHTIGNVMSKDEFEEYRMMNGIGIYSNYYSEFISGLNKELYGK